MQKAEDVAENDAQREVIRLLIEFYRTGDLKLFDAYSIAWLKDTDSLVDFVNGFIESYGDPLGMKASWESIVNFKDMEATHRTETISSNAQWFEDHSPVDARFKKTEVKGVSAKVITAAILAGDLYPSTAIGINLPNSNWIRSVHGSKSVTIGNLTDAYNKAARGNGFREEFVYSETERQLLEKYADITDDLHTDLHECLGHGSGKLLPGVDPDALKAHGSTIEEARADLFGLYYLPDAKMIELGLVPDAEAYKAEYYSYMMNGLMTQLVRIEPGCTVEEAHMRNRQLIACWALEHGQAEHVVEMVNRDGKLTCVLTIMLSCVCCLVNCWPKFSASRAREIMRQPVSWLKRMPYKSIRYCMPKSCNDIAVCIWLLIKVLSIRCIRHKPIRRETLPMCIFLIRKGMQSRCSDIAEIILIYNILPL